jgi:formylglycine-generating enzyme required for sulfatase activity
MAAAAVLVLAIALPQFRKGDLSPINADMPFAGFAQVPKGRLNMGNPRGMPDEQPVHIVTLEPFRMAKYEVTVAEFGRFIAATGYQTDAERRSGSNIWVSPDSLRFGEGVNWRCDPQGRLRPPGDSLHPVLHVSWNDAQAYCAWLGRQKGHAFRLPTEAEWEYAARGGKWSDSLLTPFAGGQDPYQVAIFFGNSGGSTWPVGSKAPNALGIHDLSGNAWEWCADGYAADYYARSPGHNPRGDSTASLRVGRGGGWSATREQLVLTRRYAAAPDYSDFGLGFRVVEEGAAAHFSGKGL